MLKSAISTTHQFVNDDDQASRDAIQEVQRLFHLATEYGFVDYLVFDASVVRGLANYTGIRYRMGSLRSERRTTSDYGGGRYDRLLELDGESVDVLSISDDAPLIDSLVSFS